MSKAARVMGNKISVTHNDDLRGELHDGAGLGSIYS